MLINKTTSAVYALLFLSSLAIPLPAYANNSNTSYSDGQIVAIMGTAFGAFLVGTALTYMLTAKEKTLEIRGDFEVAPQYWKTITSGYDRVIVCGGIKIVFPSMNHTADSVDSAALDTL